MIKKTFFDDVDNPLKYVLYSDTDSLYINVPSLKPKDPEEGVKFADQVGTELNDVIERFTVDHLLKKMNVAPEHNMTFYKTELTAESILFLDVKKNYAYAATSKEGRTYDTPKIKYTGIPVVRNEYSGVTKDFIRALVEDIALNKKINGKVDTTKALNDLANKSWNRIITDSKSGDFSYIGSNGKFGTGVYKKEPAGVVGMKLYNTLTQTETFKPMMAGKFVPINIKNQKIFNDLITPIKNRNELYIGPLPFANIRYMTVPYTYNKEELLELMKKFTIEVDIKALWAKSVSKSAERIIEAIKRSNGIPLK
jgi:DNA polymerase elongation subunit (family B)